MSLSQCLFATWYDLLNSCVESRLIRFREKTAGRAYGEVLEIGGGTGANLRFFPEDSRLTVVEPNPHMATRLLRKAREQERELILVSDFGEALSFPDSSFDTVVTTLVLCMVKDMDGVLSEIRRVIKPGGTFLFYEHVIAQSQHTRVLQNILNPLWKLTTTGCHLNRDILSSISSVGFRKIEVESFHLTFGMFVKLPNILGSAKM